MAFTDESLKAKLSTLNESQDSIVSVSKWIMHHRRHADRIASFWLQRLRDTNAAKRLNLLYLVNEIVQNSRARRKDDFPNAFSPTMAEAAQTAYQSSPTEVQQKIRRLIEVWRARNVFEVPIQDAIEARLDDIDKSRPAGKKPLMGGSLFGSSTGSGGLPKELESLAPLQLAVSKANLSTTSTVNAAKTEYGRLNDADAVIPAPPLYAARLSALLKTLATAESSASRSIQTRRALVAELEKILANNRTSLSTDESSLEELQDRKVAMETKRREVEDKIRLTANAEPEELYNNGRERSESFAPMDRDSDRPEYEALTPPPVEALTPIGSPSGHVAASALDLHSNTPAADPESQHNPDVQQLLASMTSAEPTISPQTKPPDGPPHGVAPVTNGLGSGPTPSKKRKMSHPGPGGGVGEMAAGFGLELDLDEDVAEMIRQESRGAASAR